VGKLAFFKRKMLSFQIIFPPTFFNIFRMPPKFFPPNVFPSLFKNTKNYEGANLQMFQNLDECFFNQTAVLQFLLLCMLFLEFFTYI